jgi:hypothetical protein
LAFLLLLALVGSLLLLRLPFTIFYFFADCCLSSLLELVYSSSSYIINEAKEEVCVWSEPKKVVHKSGHKIPQVFRPIVLSRMLCVLA